MDADEAGAADPREVKTNVHFHQVAGRPRAGRIVVTRQASQARQWPGATSGHQAAIVMIGLAMAARLARDPRTYAPAIVVVIAVAAVAGLGRASRARTFARLAAWDKGRSTTQPAQG